METDFKCRFCKKCNGFGCKGQIPGMGGVNGSRNFIINCTGWQKIYDSEKSVGRADKIDSIIIAPENVGSAPVTGAVQNIGFKEEKDFYLPYFTAAKNCGITICVGDGAPDEKLLFGVEATKALYVKSYFFLKPYPDGNLIARINLVREYAAAIGMDIDAYNIPTMHGQVRLEQKTREQIERFRDISGLPLMLKGIFTDDDLELCKTVKPDIAVVSNHGGRVERSFGSSAEFLQKNADILRSCCKEVWVDGGIRTVRDIQTALYLGADKVLIARPFITALCMGGIQKMEEKIKGLFSQSLV